MKEKQSQTLFYFIIVNDITWKKCLEIDSVLNWSSLKLVFELVLALDHDNTIYQIVGLLGIVNTPIATYVIWHSKYMIFKWDITIIMYYDSSNSKASSTQNCRQLIQLSLQSVMSFYGDRPIGITIDHPEDCQGNCFDSSM